MSFGIGLNAGLKALAAARYGIETAGQNVANANTPGYSRQRLIQASAYPFWVNGGLQVGTGVEVSDIRRLVDEGIERRLRLQLGIHGSAEVDFARWSELESSLNEPAGGLSNNFTDLFGSLSKLQTQPSSRALRGGVVQEGSSLAQAMNELTRRLSDIERGSLTEIKGYVREINEHAEAVAKLNDQIAVAENGNGGSANDMRDARERHIKEISRLADVRVLERSSGAVDLQIDGTLLVAGNRASKLAASQGDDGKSMLTLAGSDVELSPSGGRLHGLLRHEKTEIPALRAKFDRLAHNLALEFNRIHTTGVPLAGYYESSLGANAVQDLNGNGVLGDDLLSRSGLPFDITAGEVYLSVTDKESGEIEQTRIAIDPDSMSLQDVADAISAVANMQASVDPAGRLRVRASSGYGFDFSPRLDPNPDSLGTFGGVQPSHASSSSGPFTLTVPSTLRITVDGSNYDVNFTASQFANPAAATVDEVVDAIQSNTAFANVGMATNVGGRLVIRSNSSGSGATLGLSQPGPGTPLTDLTLPTPPNTVNGQDRGVNVKIGGSFTGEQNGGFTFVADGAGTIGVTSGLTISVYDADGTKVATLDAGPETKLLDNSPIEVADGVTLQLGPGSLTQGQVFHVATVADSDTSDLLVAVGLNSFFHGSDAGDIRVNPDLATSPSLLAASLDGDQGNAANLDRLLSLREHALGSLDDSSIEDFYGDIVGEVGFEAAGAEALIYAEDELLTSVQAQRDSVSGVNLDEEMIELVKYQQAFEAASRFINTVNELTETLINLGR
ncbi:MAG: flagellar hook-associated protein FlgK [Planctomycetes bacterium]|nr:flagellar hook-associated protein FlgK [Planctomycetota bacterium]